MPFKAVTVTANLSLDLPPGRFFVVSVGDLLSVCAPNARSRVGNKRVYRIAVHVLDALVEKVREKLW